ncbi:hypothetical protein, partial [Leptospira alexanderi]|uniref:hypothetical protein n=1 Tax=Leptospira alexanderi TaxID=100053 RepID=UPI001BB0C1A0
SSSTQSNSVPSALLQCLVFIIRPLPLGATKDFKYLAFSDICGVGYGKMPYANTDPKLHKDNSNQKLSG